MLVLSTGGSGGLLVQSGALCIRFVKSEAGPRLECLQGPLAFALIVREGECRASGATEGGGAE